MGFQRFRACLIFTGSLALLITLPAQAQKEKVQKQPKGSPASELKKEIDSARKSGYPVSAKELQRPLPPPDQNAALLYLQWHDLRYKSNRITSQDDFTMSEAYSLNANEAQIAAARKVYQEKKEAFDLIHAAVARPQCVFVKDYSLGPAQIFPELADMRS